LRGGGPNLLARRSPARLAALLALAGVVPLGLACQTTTAEPSFEDLPPADELYEEGLERMESRTWVWLIPRVDYQGAIESFQAIIDNYPYSEYAVQAELRIADAYFEDKRYEEALSYYRDFADLHPQHERVPYTILRSALCHYEEIATIDRDQTAAREAMGYLERLLREYPYAPETRQGEALLLELRKRLARSTMAKGDFYMERDEHQAAAERYRSVLNEYPGLGYDAEALYNLGVCYHEMKREDEALRLFHVILENFEDSDLAEEAAERIAAAE